MSPFQRMSLNVLALFCALVILRGECDAQINNILKPKHDFIWLTGYDSNSGIDLFGTSVLNFNVNPIEITREEREMNFYLSCISISDENGNLIFYSNGEYIADKNDGIMENGEYLNPPNGVAQNSISQNTLALPLPGNNNVYYVIHERSSNTLSPPLFNPIFECYYSIIDMTLNDGAGKVISGQNLLIQDTLCYGKLTATRHANGRDWWIIIPKLNKSIFYVGLLSPSGLEILPLQTFQGDLKSSNGQSVISPDGSKYIRLNCPGISEMWLDIFDFDRCSGLLSNFRRIYKTGNDGLGTGVAISSNSRLLYLSKPYQLYQYDLWSDDIESSGTLIDIYDGYLSPFETVFMRSLLSPDGRIIIRSGSVDIFHVIDYPNKIGTECSFRQHAIQLPALNDQTIPNNPNYRLGPLDDSSCDTIGLDNLPIAYFRADTSLNSLIVKFVDLSTYNPQIWRWDFGDGSSLDSNQYPNHEYLQTGIYNVCLSVSNTYAKDTFCAQISVGTTEVNSLFINLDDTQVFPSLFTTTISVSMPSWNGDPLYFVLKNLYGQEVGKALITTEQTDVRVGQISNGIYLWHIYSKKNHLLKSGKIVKIRK